LTVVAGTLAVVNPLGAVVPQNKRCFALMWEQIHRFPPEAQAAPAASAIRRQGSGGQVFR